jgi:hypothetical protein
MNNLRKMRSPHGAAKNLPNSRGLRLYSSRERARAGVMPASFRIAPGSV